MKVSLLFAVLLLAVLTGDPSAAHAESRMQVAVPSSPVMNQASSGAQSVGSVAAGEILFVSRVEGNWAAVSPPERFTLWLNKDFIEGNRVVAKAIQVRSGPGIQHPVVGMLKRGDPVMPRGEEGDWCKIAPPSSCLLWVSKQDLTEVKARTTPIREVEAVVEPAKPAPVRQSAAPAKKGTKPAPKRIAPKPAAKPAAKPANPAPPLSPSPVQIAPSKPRTDTPDRIVRRTSTRTPTATTAKAPAPATQAPVVTPARKKKRTQAAARKTVAPSSTSTAASSSGTPALRPATALPVQPTPPPKKRVRKRKTPAKTTPVPAPAKKVAKPKKQKLSVQVDPALVEDLDLADVPTQGKSVQVEGEVRNAPFLTASPSRYRLLDYDDRVLEMVCHLHGDSTILRQFVGKGVSIRGREYWVENSDMPVVVVGEIIPLAPSTAAEEPVLF
jgi:uncharacterized protein YgiM (DUF1202 family)